MSRFNFYNDYLFGFEALIFATLQILYMHKQLVTLQRQRLINDSHLIFGWTLFLQTRYKTCLFLNYLC